MMFPRLGNIIKLTNLSDSGTTLMLGIEARTVVLGLLKTPQLFSHYLLYRWQSKNYMTCICRWVHCASDEMAWLESFFGLSWVPEKMPPKISQWWPPKAIETDIIFLIHQVAGEYVFCEISKYPWFWHNWKNCYHFTKTFIESELLSSGSHSVG